jgi:hypothetical protein
MGEDGTEQEVHKITGVILKSEPVMGGLIFSAKYYGSTG